MYRQKKRTTLGSVFFISALSFLAATVPVMSQGTGNQTSQAEEPKGTK